MAEACPKCGWQPVGGPACPRCGVHVAGYLAELAAGASRAAMVEPSAQPSAPMAIAELRAAGFWIRALAVLIDTVVVLVAQALLYAVGSMVFGSRSSMVIRVAAQAFGTLLVAVYPVFFHWRWARRSARWPSTFGS
jgi:hypothetical protein